MRGREDMAAAVEDFRAAVVVAAQAWRGPASAADRASETSPDAQPLSARVREHLRAARLSPDVPSRSLEAAGNGMVTEVTGADGIGAATVTASQAV